MKAGSSSPSFFSFFSSNILVEELQLVLDRNIIHYYLCYVLSRDIIFELLIFFFFYLLHCLWLDSSII